MTTIQSHTVQRLIDRLRFKKKTLSLFTMEALDDKLAEYSGSENVSLSSDVAFLLKSRNDIERLFQKPDTYENGGEFKAKIQRLIEYCFLRTITEKNTELQDSLINLVYRFHKTIYSLDLQEGIIFGLEKYGEETINQAKYDMLAYFYSFNAESFNNVTLDKLDFKRRIDNQKRILRFFLSHNNSQILKQLDQKLKNNNDIQTQISQNTYLEIYNSATEDCLNFPETVLSKKQKELLSIALGRNINKRYLIQDIYDKGLPEQIGHMHIRGLISKKLLYNLVEDETLTVEYRLYALRRLVSIETNPFGAIFILERIRSELSAKFSIKEDSKMIITEDNENALRVGAEKILNNNFRKLSTGDNYLDSLEAEMLFTAAAVLLHEKYLEVDLVEFLKQLKFTFVRDGNTEFIVQYTGDSEAEHVRILMKNNEIYIKAIKDFVDSIYERNRDGIPAGQGRMFTSVSKGPMRLITVVKRRRL